MKQKMEKEQYRVAKAHLVAEMQEGQSWQRVLPHTAVDNSDFSPNRLTGL